LTERVSAYPARRRQDAGNRRSLLALCQRGVGCHRAWLGDAGRTGMRQAHAKPVSNERCRTTTARPKHRERPQPETRTHQAFRESSVTTANSAIWLISRRSRVQIPPPLRSRRLGPSGLSVNW
jgi:hypothetical protein